MTESQSIPPSSSFTNPCELVRSTCRKWMEQEQDGMVEHHGRNNNDHNGGGRRTVRLRYDKLPNLAKEILSQRKRSSTITPTEAPSSSTTTTSGSSTIVSTATNTTWIEWDADEWHYNGKAFRGSQDLRRERVALYLLCLDAINFCFWPFPNDDDNYDDSVVAQSITASANENPIEYEHLATALKRLAEADDCNTTNEEFVLSPNNLSTMTPDKMKQILAPYLDMNQYPLPNISRRAELWREVGDGLKRDYDGSATELLNRANQDASRLVELVTTSFPGFQDEVYLPSEDDNTNTGAASTRDRIVFLKRAQIFVGDVNSALQLELKGMSRLTTFADYRVPQILRHWEVLEYAPSLANTVDSKQELMAGSADEISIRTATVLAVEELVKLLNQELKKEQKGGCEDVQDNFTDVTVDWYLWQVGERMHQEGIMKPFHRVRTHFY